MDLASSVTGSGGGMFAEAHTPTPLLRCVDVRKSFRGVEALSGVSFAVNSGEVAALIGPNGAGKTTIFNCICGTVRPDSGAIWIGGQRLMHPLPAEVARLGVGRTFQNLRMFVGLTAFESVLAALTADRSRPSGVLSRLRHGRRSAGIKAMDLLDLVGIAGRAREQATRLALVEQRRLEVARALATSPKILLADEPAAGSTPAEARELESLFRQLADDHGLTVVLIEHTMGFVLNVASVIHVLDFGRIIRSGSPSDISGDEQVRALYIGRFGTRRAQ